MQVNGIKPVRGYKKPRSIAGRPSIIAPNRLQRVFTVDAPNKDGGQRHAVSPNILDRAFVRFGPATPKTVGEAGRLVLARASPNRR